MDDQQFRELPDFLPIEKVATLFSSVLDAFDKKQISRQRFLSIICELTDRQTQTYQLLDTSLRIRVDLALCNAWNTDSYDDVDNITYIIINLGLEKCYKKAIESLQQKNLSTEIRAEIEEMVEEIGENISNPLDGFFRS